MTTKNTRRGFTQKHKVILNSIQDLQRLPLLFINDLCGRFQIKFGMTALFDNGGFTLIELLVVVLIIGILAAVAVPQYQKAVLKSRLVQMQVYIDALRKGAEMYFLANGNYTTDIEKLDIDITSGAKEIKKSNITSGNIKGVFFEHDIECVVTSHAVACLSPNFYLTRKHDYNPDQNPDVAQWPEGIECVGRNKDRGDQLAEQICKAMSDGVPVEDYTNFESKAYIIGD